MHKARLNMLALAILIRPNGPILIKSGREGAINPAIPDMSFVRTRSPLTNHRGKPTVYLPGSSLKGVLRSYCESISRALQLSPEVCNPLETEQRGNRCRTERATSADQYRESCYICRLFGSTRLGGRIAIADAYPGEDEGVFDDTNLTASRTGVGIDRLLGSSYSGALYDFEVVEQGAFFTHIFIENFELWQVGLLALALRDLNSGHLRLGSGTSRGMGFVTVEILRAEVRYTGLLSRGADDTRQLLNRYGAFYLECDSARRLYGVADLLSEEEAKHYGMERHGAVEVVMEADRIRSEGIDVQIILKSPRSPDERYHEALFAACVQHLVSEAEARTTVELQGNGPDSAASRGEEE